MVSRQKFLSSYLFTVPFASARDLNGVPVDRHGKHVIFTISGWTQICFDIGIAQTVISLKAIQKYGVGSGLAHFIAEFGNSRIHDTDVIEKLKRGKNKVMSRVFVFGSFLYS